MPNSFVNNFGNIAMAFLKFLSMVIPWYFLNRDAKRPRKKPRSRRSKEKRNYDGQPAINYRLKATALKIAPNSIKRAIRNRRPTSTLVPIEKSVITESRRRTCVFLPLPTTPLTSASGQLEQKHAFATRT